MGKSTKILSFILVFILILTSAFLFSCEKPTNTTEAQDTSVSSNYIIKTEIKDGCIWVTYSNDPQNPVNIGSVSASSANSAESFLTFMPLSDGTYGVTAGNSRYLDTIVIPETHNGKAVTTILENAFNGAINLKSITIPNSITTVGDHAFENCGKLEYYEQDNALYLGNPENNTLILVKAKDTLITRCVVSEKAIAICDNAFNGCYELSSLEIPDSIKNIGAYAFKDCTMLGTVKIPDGVAYIGAETFKGCANLRKMSIPASVASIGKSAFANCISLSEVTFAEGSALNGIANETFSGCKNLSAITIPQNVEYIGDNKATANTNGAFNGCTSLSKVTFEKNSKLKQIGNYAFNSCESLSDISLPNTVNQIGHSAFRGAGLVKIKLPESVLVISDNTFYNCDSLESVAFSSKLTKIGHQAFSNCLSLDDVILPASLRTVGSSAFYRCSSLKSVTVKDATSWYVMKNRTEKLDAEKFADSAVAAEYFTTTYYDYTFGK